MTEPPNKSHTKIWKIMYNPKVLSPVHHRESINPLRSRQST